MLRQILQLDTVDCKTVGGRASKIKEKFLNVRKIVKCKTLLNSSNTVLE